MIHSNSLVKDLKTLSRLYIDMRIRYIKFIITNKNQLILICILLFFLPSIIGLLVWSTNMNSFEIKGTLKIICCSGIWALSFLFGLSANIPFERSEMNILIQSPLGNGAKKVYLLFARYIEFIFLLLITTISFILFVKPVRRLFFSLDLLKMILLFTINYSCVYIIYDRWYYYIRRKELQSNIDFNNFRVVIVFILAAWTAISLIAYIHLLFPLGMNIESLPFLLKIPIYIGYKISFFLFTSPLLYSLSYSYLNWTILIIVFGILFYVYIMHPSPIYEDKFSPAQVGLSQISNNHDSFDSDLDSEIKKNLGQLFLKAKWISKKESSRVGVDALLGLVRLLFLKNFISIIFIILLLPIIILMYTITKMDLFIAIFFPSFMIVSLIFVVYFTSTSLQGISYTDYYIRFFREAPISSEELSQRLFGPIGIFGLAVYAFFLFLYAINTILFDWASIFAVSFKILFGAIIGYLIIYWIRLELIFVFIYIQYSSSKYKDYNKKHYKDFLILIGYCIFLLFFMLSSETIQILYFMNVSGFKSIISDFPCYITIFLSAVTIFFIYRYRKKVVRKWVNWLVTGRFE